MELLKRLLHDQQVAVAQKDCQGLEVDKIMWKQEKLRTVVKTQAKIVRKNQNHQRIANL